MMPSFEGTGYMCIVVWSIPSRHLDKWTSWLILDPAAIGYDVIPRVNVNTVRCIFGAGVGNFVKNGSGSKEIGWCRWNVCNITQNECALRCEISLEFVRWHMELDSALAMDLGITRGTCGVLSN
jgi:hypothetical protein